VRAFLPELIHYNIPKMTRLTALLGAALALLAASAQAEPIRIVAAESVYADVARQIAGPGAAVSAILTNPDQDPHLFEPTASAARAVARARIVVLNGAGYDPWMRRLIDAQPNAGRIVLDTARLVHAAPGANPHLWYDPGTMPAFARALADNLVRLDADGGAAARADVFIASLAPLHARIAAVRQRWSGTEVAATEPIFGDMASALGLEMLDPRFQLAVMNGTEPAASDIAALEQDLRTHRARVLIVNSQASNPAVERLRRIAAAAGVPAVAVSETEPPGQSYQVWMLAQLDALDAALAR
jgi:zinc/manganese transport system substrate-binding protein